jgi:hypothetical protein
MPTKMRVLLDTLGVAETERTWSHATLDDQMDMTPRSIESQEVLFPKLSSFEMPS